LCFRTEGVDTSSDAGRLGPGDAPPHSPARGRRSAIGLPPTPATWKLPEMLASAQKGRLCAGGVFVQSAAQRESLAAASQAALVDMNTHGLLAACANHHLPVQVWRVVSDAADEQAAQVFRAFVANYDGAGGRALAALIKTLPASPNAAQGYPGIQRLLTPAQ